MLHIVCHQGNTNLNDRGTTHLLERSEPWNTGHAECCRGLGARGALTHCGWECRWGTTAEGSLTASYKAKHIPFCDCAPWYLPKGLKSHVRTKTRIQMFIASVFIIANTWKQPKCPPLDE